MIPKIIHYCWFGGHPLPASTRKYIESWRKFLPGYEIKEWNESNFDVDALPYTRDAYAARKYAFVSDYVRFKVLYEQGGLYFDTDVEVVRPLDDIIARGPFMGWETANALGQYSIAPGLCIGCEPGMAWLKAVLDEYQTLAFRLPDGRINPYSMIPMVTRLLGSNGLRMDGSEQAVSGLTLYPADFFCPMNSLTGEVRLTDNTRTIHWYSMSWLPWWRRLRLRVMRRVRRYL